MVNQADEQYDEQYVYLHGFASGPQSAKAQFFGDRLRARQCAVLIPDLNQNCFYTLTLTRQIQQVQALLPSHPTTVIGSSLGGLTAAWLAEQCPQIHRLVLLAPAFHFLQHWLPRLGVETVRRWQEERSLPIYHYGAQQWLPLDYQFVTDAQRYDEAALQRPVPTLIIHGQRDDVIPIQASRAFVAQRPWTQLIEVDSDHALTDVQDDLWSMVQTFCGL